MPPLTPPLDLDRLRRRLAAETLSWRSLEEAAGDERFLAMLRDEFPAFAAAGADALDRRRFLQLAAASLALGGLGGCGEPPEDIIAAVEDDPAEAGDGSRRFATAVPIGGIATGILVKHALGRPVKIEGNPDHPASLGATSAVLEASILDLYDPSRSRTVLSRGRIRSDAALDAALRERAAMAAARHGEGLRILTGATSSPTLTAAIERLRARLPAMRWHRWEPLHRGNVHEGGRLAFGRAVEPVARIERADVVLAVESDLLSSAPGHLAHARGFAERRAPERGAMLRLYAVEASPTLTGANADHRLVATPGELGSILRALAAQVGAGPRDWRGLAEQGWIGPLARDLAAHRGRALVHVGPEQPAALHALGHLLNDTLGGPVDLIDPPEGLGAADERALAELVEDMTAGRVETLLVLGSNPVYSAPADLGFAEAMARVPFTLALASHVDETAHAALWHAPEAHVFERWGDARAFDGTASIVQPQVRPFHGGRSALDIVALLSGDAAVDPRATWRDQGLGDDGSWTAALRRGVVPNSAATPLALRPRADLATTLPPPDRPAPLALLFRPDPFLGDGSRAANGWLQELPRPLTRLAWGNAALVAPATAEALALSEGDIVTIEWAGRRLEAPVSILPGHAPGCATLPLGFGRRAGAGIGDGIGFDAGALRMAAQSWLAPGATLAKTGRRHAPPTVQHHHTMAGREIVRVATLDELHREPAQAGERAPDISLYPPREDRDGPAWAMVVDLNACIGCGACAAACQAENNVPVVGETELRRGREMHWLRIDRYWRGGLDAPETLFQPVLCMHCEKAPCEVVCPVQATTHDRMGLNVMTYNRCVGTRFCANNCPYKVRRFNFFDYGAREERPADARNPDVTVRSRGVMEKCTYCVQRIARARIAAERESRPLRDGEVETACQAACPTRAFTFGDLADPGSAVSRAKASARGYDLLAELNTRPRTSYAARVRNPNPEIEEA